MHWRKKRVYPFFYVGSHIYLELLFKGLTAGRLYFGNFLIPSVFAACYALVILLISSCFPKRASRWISAFLLLVHSILFSSQWVYFSIFKTYYSFYSAFNAGQILPFWREILVAVFRNLFWILLFFIPVIFTVVFRKKWGDFLSRSRVPGFRLLSLASLFYLAAIILIREGGDDINSAYDLYYKSNIPVISVEKLGLLTTMRLEMQRHFTGWTPASGIALPHPEPAPSGPEEREERDKDSGKAAEETGKPQILPIDFDRLIKEERDPAILEMHRYFQNVEPTTTNEWTGRFKGYNFIFITAEGFSPLGVRRDVTPTLYQLIHNGVYFTNFYTPIWSVSTSDGEYVATTGLIPKTGVWSYYESGNNYMPFAMGNQLRKLGYKTVAYHNHTYDYYRRDVSHPNMGYDYKGVGNGLVVKETWPESDLEMMRVTVPEYIDHEPFHAYYMTVSGHLRYTFTGNYIAYKNRNLVEHLPYSEEARAYIATQIELDRALAYLLEQLKARGIAGRTLIALSADHYPYGLNKKTIDELAGKTVEENFELYKNAFILYAEGMDPVTVDRPASSLDIIPTLSNLLGLGFDSRLLMGRDVFSKAEPLVIFSNRSFITDRGKFNALTNQFIPEDGVKVDDKYINRMKETVNHKFYFSAKILDLDYYAKVFPDSKR